VIGGKIAKRISDCDNIIVGREIMDMANQHSLANQPETAKRGGDYDLSWSLAQSDLLRLMVDTVTDYAILWLDTEGHIRSWNPGAERIKGYKAEEIVGRHFSVFYEKAAVDAQVPEAELLIARQEGRFEDEGWRVRKDGSLFWANVVITALRDGRGILVGYAKVTRDLTERRRSEHELAEANRMVTSVLESTSDCVVQVDRNWSILYKNARAKERFPDCKLNGNFWDCYPELRESDAGRALLGGMEQRREAQIELDLIAGNQCYSVSAYPNNDGLSLFLHDITREKMLAQELKKEQIMREKRIETLSHLAGGLTHEISNPLAIIHAVANDLQLAAADGASVSSPEIVKACDQIVRTSDRAMAILRGLKAFSRDASRDPMVSASIEAIVRSSVEMQMGRFERHRIELRLAVQPGIPAILCREVQIGQIVTNLINNAFDSINSGNCEERWVAVRLSVVVDYVCMDVTDSGPGVPEHIRARLMQPFFTTKESSGGTGIGLSLSRGIAQDHGGDLIFSEIDERPCFRLLLPIPHPPSASNDTRSEVTQ
jgi:PAS domain S-box-containing protein